VSARMKAFWAKRRARAGGRQAAKEVACRKQGVLARRHLRYRGGGLDCRPSWHRQGRGTPPRVRRGGDSPTPAYGRMTARLVTAADQGRMLWARPPAPNTNVATTNVRHTAIASAVRSLIGPSPRPMYDDHASASWKGCLWDLRPISAAGARPVEFP